MEKAIARLESYIDRGVDITRLSKELSDSEYQSFRKYVSRDSGLAISELVDNYLKAASWSPSKIDLERCFYISDDYKVSINEFEKEHLLDLCNITDDDFRNLTSEIIYELEKDALDYYYRDHFPDGMKFEYIRNNGFYHLRMYLKRHYNDSFHVMLSEYRTKYETFVDRRKDHVEGLQKRQTLGRYFEDICGQVLDALYGESNVRKQVVFGDCHPDFVINGGWYDAKLSQSTVYHRGCDTLEKYAKHTDKVTIIYALGAKMNKDYGSYRMLHISNLYEKLEEVGRYDLIDVCETFIATNKEAK